MVYHLKVTVHVAGSVAAMTDVALAQLALRMRTGHALEVRPDPAATHLLSWTVWKLMKKMY